MIIYGSTPNKMPACVFWLCVFWKNIFCVHCAGIKLYSRERHTRNGKSTKRAHFFLAFHGNRAGVWGRHKKCSSTASTLTKINTLRYLLASTIAVCAQENQMISELFICNWFHSLSSLSEWASEWVSMCLNTRTCCRCCYANDEESKCVHDNGKISLHIYRALNIIIVIFFGNSSLFIVWLSKKYDVSIHHFDGIIYARSHTRSKLLFLMVCLHI